MREHSQLLDLAVADDLDHGRRNLQRRGVFAPDLHMRRPAMGIEILAGFPALDHHEKVGIVDAGVAVIGDAAVFLAGGRDAFLRALDEGVPQFRLHLRGGDDVDHGSVSRFLLFIASLVYRTSTFSGVMISIFGGADMHVTAMRPNAFMCSAARCGTSASAFSHCSTNTILLGSVTLSCISYAMLPGSLRVSLMQAVAPAMNSARVSGFTVNVATT